MEPSQGQLAAAKSNAGSARRILFASIGSLGDIHPCIALGLELKSRGHTVNFATTEYYRDSIIAHGFGFHSLRPAWDPSNADLVARCEDLKRGPETLIRELILPHLEDTYKDLLSAAAGVDLMLAGELNYAAPLVAEKLHLPWVSIILSPISFFSAHDPSLLVNALFLIHLRHAGASINRTILNLSRVLSRHWFQPVRTLRKREGLHPKCDPLFGDKFSSHLTLALFSKHFAEAQPDWPAATLQPGFVFYDRSAMDAELSEALESFFDVPAAEAPLVFTLGSTATHNPGDFYKVSAAAAQRLDRRAVLVGAGERITSLSAEVLAVPYAPYSWIFPRASVVVHQGGSGTTAQALRARRPMLIVPYGWDQPDNALRTERLGCGIHLPRKDYTVESACAAITRLLDEPRFFDAAATIGPRVSAENALSTACNAVEQLLL